VLITRLHRGEQTATALESRLDDIEGRIEQLLASVEQNAAQSGTTRIPSEADPSSKQSER
jgi:tetrahydromethanopterin S-methyltransferase subunit G